MNRRTVVFSMIVVAGMVFTVILGVVSGKFWRHAQAETLDGSMKAQTGIPVEQINLPSAMPCEHVQERKRREMEELMRKTGLTEDQISTSFEEYAIAGKSLSRAHQKYLYGQLKSRDIAWFYKVALCQLMQESSLDPDAVNKNGKDKGLCQIREEYFEERAQAAGLKNADIFNPIESMYVYCHMMDKYLRMTDGDVPMALSWYHLNNGEYSEKYVNDVLRWVPQVEKKEVEK